MSLWASYHFPVEKKARKKSAKLSIFGNFKTAITSFIYKLAQF